MDRKRLIARTLAKAEKYYCFTRWIDDQETVQRILGLTAKLRRRARAIATPTENRIRRRARALWEESGWSFGRDLEFWLQAEREFQEAEDLAKNTRAGAVAETRLSELKDLAHAIDTGASSWRGGSDRGPTLA